MKILILSLIIGIIIGITKIIPKKHMKFNSYFQLLALIILLFSMGASIGSNKEILSSLNTIGIKAITFSIMTIIFSVIVMYIVSKKFLNTNNQSIEKEEIQK
ncbi:LysO family transporter [Tepidibacter formicigenes]|jgi:hypothetical protein|uniref:Lysine exporter LysO n=1 Tax=Tepidibacter formicigenes DSM 15518 TaxID=1123349 RepID=A0A1M6SFH7_9FIRM|nr:LysO family transporter [Tepidibacter formicigenes]SHK43337.1 Membrane protein of unknown function [Tepidibacter formicigenes DSM 15518]